MIGPWLRSVRTPARGVASCQSTLRRRSTASSTETTRDAATGGAANPVAAYARRTRQAAVARREAPLPTSSRRGIDHHQVHPVARSVEGEEEAAGPGEHHELARVSVRRRSRGIRQASARPARRRASSGRRRRASRRRPTRPSGGRGGPVRCPPPEGCEDRRQVAADLARSAGSWAKSGESAGRRVYGTRIAPESGTQERLREMSPSAPGEAKQPSAGTTTSAPPATKAAAGCTSAPLPSAAGRREHEQCERDQRADGDTVVLLARMPAPAVTPAAMSARAGRARAHGHERHRDGDSTSPRPTSSCRCASGGTPRRGSREDASEAERPARAAASSRPMRNSAAGEDARSRRRRGGARSPPTARSRRNHHASEVERAGEGRVDVDVAVEHAGRG